MLSCPHGHQLLFPEADDGRRQRPLYGGLHDCAGIHEQGSGGVYPRYVGRKDATDEDVMAAAKAAHCHEFIEKLPNGYQTVIGENGSTLSGGECQRLSIARALLKDAPVILLDEATASLDVDNETEIQEAITHLVRGKTVLIIAHRMRTVEKADKIIVLDGGVVAESGTHEELMGKNGLYHKLVELQTAAADWKLRI